MSTAPTPLPKQPLTFAASHLVWIAALAALCALGVYEWIQEHDARVKAEAATAAQQKTIDQAQKDAGDAQQALMVKMAAIDAEKLEPATPRQIVIDTSKLIPNLPQPITIRTAPQQVGGSAGQRTSDGLPDAPAAQSLIVPAADLKAIQAAEIACQEDQAKLTACTLTAADTQTELKATTTQRDEWEKTAKGGTWLHRTLTAAKWIGIGAAVGYAAGHR